MTFGHILLGSHNFVLTALGLCVKGPSTPCISSITTLNKIFSVTYYLELHNAMLIIIDVFVHQVKLLLFYNVQTTNLTFFGTI